MADKRIKQILLPTGDWFRLRFEHVEGKQWINITRVCAWAVIGNGSPLDEDAVDGFEGIDSSGVYVLDEQSDVHWMYVSGGDLAPNSKTWLTVFNETAGTGMPWSKDVSDIVKSA